MIVTVIASQDGNVVVRSENGKSIVVAGYRPDLTIGRVIAGEMGGGRLTGYFVCENGPFDHVMNS